MKGRVLFILGAAMLGAPAFAGELKFCESMFASLRPGAQEAPSPMQSALRESGRKIFALRAVLQASPQSTAVAARLQTALLEVADRFLENHDFQPAIWALREAGETGRAAQWEQKLQQAMLSGEVRVLGPVSSNGIAQARWVEITDPELGKFRAIQKTERTVFESVVARSVLQGPGDPSEASQRARLIEFQKPRYEVAAYALDRFVGADYVPLTVLRPDEGREASLQVFLEGAASAKQIAQRPMVSADFHAMKRDASARDAFRLLLGGFSDNHNENSLLVEGLAKAFEVDFGLNFNPQARHFMQRSARYQYPHPWEGLKDRPDILKKLKTLKSKEQLRQVLGNILTEEELEENWSAIQRALKES